MQLAPNPDVLLHLNQSEEKQAGEWRDREILSSSRNQTFKVNKLFHLNAILSHGASILNGAGEA